MKLSETVAVVTGGASGLGEAVVRHVVGNGGKAAIIDLNEERAAALANEFSGSVIHAGRDVTSAEDVTEAMTKTQDAFGSLNAAVNCAGIAIAEKTLGRDGPHDLARYQRVVDINLSGSFNVARLAAERMAQNDANTNGERGAIVFTASIAAFDGQKGQPAYAASKGGIVGMTLAMARDLSQNGIRVNTIAPGLFLTPMMASLPEPAQEALSQQPLFPKRLGNPAEFGRLAGFMIECPYMNAETVRLDAGVRLP